MKGEPSKRELKGRIDLFLDDQLYVSKGGSRACTMCGCKGQDCLDMLRTETAWCCLACGDGNTHTAPGENDGSCAEWAAKRDEESG